jgi:outer membrane protein assembly factor BamA
VSRAAAVIKDLLAAPGCPSANVKISFEKIPRTTAVAILFTVDEGPRAKSS